MSCGDDSKPTVNPPAGREDNPFDITKRPQHEVAAEIASRLASWKQARNRSNSTAAPATDTNRTVDGGRSDVEQSPLAPVQPQVPKPSGHEAHSFVNEPRPPAVANEPPQSAEPAPARSRSSDDREPLAPFAMRRAMPPAPSPRRPTEAAEPPIAARTERPTGDSAAATTAKADAPERRPALDARNEPPAAPATSTPPRIEPRIEHPAGRATTLRAERPGAEPPHAERASSELPPEETADLRIEPQLLVPGTEAPRIEPRIEMPRARTPAIEATSAESPWAKVLRAEGERIEPTFGPGPRKAASEARRTIPPIEIEVAKGYHPGLPWMMTRLERAERNVPPSMPVAPMPSRQRSGHGWAIGLGAVLLLVGVTSPAAIWQHWQMTARARLDQAVMVNQAATPDTNAQTTAEATPPAPPPPAQPTAEATPPAPPPPAQLTAEATPPAPPSPAQPTAQAPDPTSDAAPNAPDAPAPQQQASAGTPEPMQQVLAAIGEGGDVSEAPISAPPQPDGEATTTAGAPSATTMFPSTPRPFRQPFQRDQAQGPFQQAPRPFQPPQATPYHSLPAPLVLKPNLSARLKPEQEASVEIPPPAVASNTSQSVSRPVTRRSATPQSLDQMFNMLINELADGRPTERERQPDAEPSNRR